MPEITYCLECEDETINKDSICEFCRCGECGTAEKQKLTQDAFKCLDPHCGAINLYNQPTRTYEVVVDSLGRLRIEYTNTEFFKRFPGKAFRAIGETGHFELFREEEGWHHYTKIMR